MTTARWLTSLPVSALAVTLTACGNDLPDNARAANQPPEAPPGCVAQVEVTGDVEAAWEADAEIVKVPGKASYYRTTDGTHTLSIYPAYKGFPVNVQLAVGDQRYTTQSNDGFVVDPEGDGASVDTDAAGVRPGTDVHIVAEVEC